MDSRTLSKSQQQELNLITQENIVSGIKWYQRGFTQELLHPFSIGKCPLLGSNFRAAYDISLKALDLKKLDTTNPEHIRTLELSYRYLLETKGNGALEKVPMDLGTLNARDFSSLNKIQQTAARYYGLTGYFNIIKDTFKDTNLGFAANFAFNAVTDPVEAIKIFGHAFKEYEVGDFYRNLDNAQLETIINEFPDNPEKRMQAILEKLKQDNASLDPSTLGRYTADLVEAYGILTQEEKKDLFESQVKNSAKLEELTKTFNQFFEEHKQQASENQQREIKEREIKIRQEKFAHMQQTIQRGSAFASSIAYLAGNAEMGHAIGAFGNFAIQVSTGMNEIMQAGSLAVVGINPYLLIGTAILSMVNLFSSSDDDGLAEAIAAISRQLQQIQETLLTVRREMHQRFDRVENLMDYYFRSLMHYMIDNFSAVRNDLGKLQEFNLEVRNRLEIIVGKIDDLSSQINRVAIETSIANLNYIGSDYREHYMQNKYDARNWAIHFSKDQQNIGLKATSMGEKIDFLKTPQNALGLINSALADIDKQNFNKRNPNLVNLNMFTEGTLTYLRWIKQFNKKIFDTNEIEILNNLYKFGNQTRNFLAKISKNKSIHSELIENIKISLFNLKSKIDSKKNIKFIDALLKPYGDLMNQKIDLPGYGFYTYDFSKKNERESDCMWYSSWDSLRKNKITFCHNTDDFPRIKCPDNGFVDYQKPMLYNKNILHNQFVLDYKNINQQNIKKIDYFDFVFSADRGRQPIDIRIKSGSNQHKYFYAQFLGIGKVIIKYIAKPIRPISQQREIDIFIEHHNRICDLDPIAVNEIDKSVNDNLPRLFPKAELKFYFVQDENEILFSHIYCNNLENLKSNLSRSYSDEFFVYLKDECNYVEMMVDEEISENNSWIEKQILQKEIQYKQFLSNEIHKELTTNLHENQNILNQLNFNMRLLTAIIYLANPKFYDVNLVKIMALNSWDTNAIKDELLQYDGIEDFFEKKINFFSQVFDIFSEEILKQVDANNLPNTEVKTYQPLSLITKELKTQIEFFKLNEKIESQYQALLKSTNHPSEQCQSDNADQCTTQANGAFRSTNFVDSNIVYDTDKRMAAARQSLSYQVFFLGMQVYRQTKSQALSLFEHAKNYMTQNKNSQTEIPQNSCETDCNQEPHTFSDTQFKQADQIPLLNSKPQSALPYDMATFDPTPEFDSHTKLPIFTYRSFRENQEVGTIQFYGQLEYCFSKDGERDNTLNPTGVFKNLYVEKPLENAMPCKNLPLTEGEILWSAGISSAAYGGFKGASNVFECALRKRNVSVAESWILKNMLLFGSVFTWKLGEYAMRSPQTTPETDYLQAMYHAALETGQVCISNMACDGFSKLSQLAADGLQARNHNVAAKVCNAVASISQYGLFAYQAASRPVKEMATSLASGALAQGAVEGIGKWAVKHKL